MSKQSATPPGVLNPKQIRFIDEYMIDFNGTQAAIRAGYSNKTADVQASRLLANAKVAVEIDRRRAELQERTGITAEGVLRELWGIATADANDLIEYRRNCCRHCWGIDFGYQRTLQEMERAYDDYEDQLAKATEEEAAELGEFDEKGSIGYDARRQPNKDCPECFGEGVGDVFMKDTRNLSPGVRALYAGVKVTKDGIEIKLQDKGAALERLMRHLGLYKNDNEQAKPAPAAEAVAGEMAQGFAKLAAAFNKRLGRAQTT